MNICSCRTVSFHIKQAVFLTPLLVTMSLKTKLSLINKKIFILVDCIGHLIHQTCNSFDFYLWNHMKNLICKKKLADFISVKRFRTDSFSSIKRVLDFVTENFVAKLNYSIIKKTLYLINSLLKKFLIKECLYTICNYSRVQLKVAD